MNTVTTGKVPRVASRLRRKLASTFAFSRVYDEQLASVVANQAKALVVSLLIVSIVVTVFRNSPLFTIALPWGVMALVLTIGSFIHAKLYRYSDPQDFDSENAARYSTYFASLRGVHWAIGLVTLLPTADIILQFVLGWVIIGMASGGAFAYWSLPSAAIVYVGAIGLGGVIGLLLTGQAVTILMAVAVTLYSVFVLRHALSSAALLREHVEVKHSLEKSRSDLDLLLRHFEEDSSDWLWETGADQKHARNLDRFALALGCDVAELNMRSWSDILRPRLHGEAQAAAQSRFETLLSRGKDVRDVVLRFGLPGEERIWKVSAHAKRHSNGSFAGWDGIVSDITEQRRTEEKVLHLAHHDGLTGLPNRAHFETLFREKVAMYHGQGFKAVNDTLGHITGDQLLKQASSRLQQVLGDHDILSRHGGDEFIALCVAPEGSDKIAQLTGRICAVMAEPFRILEQHVSIGASIGVTQLGVDGTALDELLRNADLALYRAKEEGRSLVRFYAPDMYVRERERQNLKLDIRNALTNREFRLHYQPIVCMEDGKVKGYEALLRWQHPTRGNIPPLNFIPLAEENGFIVELGHWVLNEACRQASLWDNERRVSVNLSAVQIRSPQLLPSVVKALADSRLLPHRLELEVTETALVEDKDAAFATLRALKALGVSISLDDFGTGYSSLAYLHEFPFDKIKIDRSFVQSCEERKQSAAVINAVLGLASELGMSTVAEGVETAEQLALLTAKGCNEAQGYFLGRPKPASEIFPAEMHWEQGVA
jgi:diguanylate cyclase (GGDEF)-like protein